MQQIKQQLFALALALWGFSSCSQDASDVQGSAMGGETITISLNAEVSVDDEQTRAIDYKLGNNAQGQLVPMPQFTDGQEVEVHTVLKSSSEVERPLIVAKTLKWRYDASKKKLVLKQNDGHSITVSAFSNEGHRRKWYISGLIGGALNGTKVEFMGSRVVRGVDGNAGDALGSMEVPYAFGWTELTIDETSPKESGYSHKYAEVLPSKDVKFKPLGSMLAVKLGTNQSAGAYTFTPKGFILSSNAWYDQGSFNLDTTIPTADTHKALPVWTESACAGRMHYSFASGEEPVTISHNQTGAKTYYVWVMQHKTLPATANIGVMLKGTSSRPETETYKDYTNIWFTDYTTEGKATQGKVTQGRVHPLTAKAIRRLALPIEYVTEYNLAGGEGLSSTVISANPPLVTGAVLLGGVQPAGVTGPLRFATSHSNDQSGYYNGYKVVGLYNENYNPNTRSLQTEIDNTFGADKYYIPNLAQWWGAIPFFHFGSYFPNDGIDEVDYMSVGSGAYEFRESYSSDYTSDQPTSDAPVYAIRFKAPYNNCYPHGDNWTDYDASTKSNRIHAYYPAVDNTMRCAYRFRVSGDSSFWGKSDGTNLTNQLIVDVVYLGEESSPTELPTVATDTWWSEQEAAGKIISRTFPATGYIRYGTPSGLLNMRGSSSYYWSNTVYSMLYGGSAWAAGFAGQSGGPVVGTNSYFGLFYSLPVRLFAHRD